MGVWCDFRRPKTTNGVIPAQAGIFQEFRQRIVLSEIGGSQTRFPPARE
ncbi:hypothetical protein HMPREF9120_00094 [Neisseria sp. oral taxon 020 str. F0370]|nr:hypothetical protein HMPREF9120_00094 [Neisseria sp. oral taxon 020 str. F0370]